MPNSRSGLRPPNKPLVLAALAVVAWLLALSVSATAPAQGPAQEPDETAGGTPSLSAKHSDFLELVAPLMHETERKVFLALDKDYRRDVFMQRFWRLRDPYPQTPRNELQERLDENFLALRDEISEAEPDEATVLLLHGKPTRRFRDACDLLMPVNVWYYRRSGLIADEFHAVFYRNGDTWSLWKPSQGFEVLLMRMGSFDREASLARVQQECSRGEELLTALSQSLDWDAVHARVLKAPNPEWAQALLESSAQVGADSEARSIQATSQFVGRRQSRVVVQTSLMLATGAQPTSAEPAGADTQPSDATRLLVDGEVIRNDQLFDSFRYRFELPAGSGPGAGHGLMIERYLRPGTYRLVLQASEPATGRNWVMDEELTVPGLAEVTAPDQTLVTAQIEEPSLVATEPNGVDGASTGIAASLRLSVPKRELLIGPFRAEAITEGVSIRRVAFELDGVRVLSKARPPYSVELDAGRVPRTHELVALAYDNNGVEIARDQVTVNAGPRRFSVRLLEPRRGVNYENSVRAVAEVDVPPLEKLDSVEFFLNEQRVATLYQQPFALPIKIPSDEPLAFVRVTAKLAGGQQTEDLVFVNSPHEVEYVDVDLVEVFATVTNRRGHPVDGIGEELFEVYEDDELQRIEEFRQVTDLPINACVLFDTSTSMIERLKEAKGAAEYFFDLVLEERDRACLMTFNDVHELVVDFTHSPEVLAGGLSQVTAEGETALYDSLIHTLYLFNGLRGKRAIILLSDGADSKSTYRFSEVLEFARRSEVTIHVIGVDIGSREMEARMRLSQLAKDTGGRTFFIDEVSELRRVYDLIERDLRSQYLLAYQSTNAGGREQFREVKVVVKERGLKARALSGYYP